MKIKHKSFGIPSDGPFKTWFHNTMKFQPQYLTFLQQEGQWNHEFFWLPKHWLYLKKQATASFVSSVIWDKEKSPRNGPVIQVWFNFRDRTECFPGAKSASLLVCLQFSTSGLYSDFRHSQSFLTALSQVLVTHADC